MIRILIFALVLPINVIACSCGSFFEPATIKDYNNAELIISGKAIRVTLNENESIDRQRQIEIKIDEAYKGAVKADTVVIYTAWSDASCGLMVNENEEWLIWAYLQNNIMVTDICTRSIQKKYVSEATYKTLRYFKSNPSATEWKNESGVLLAVGQMKNNVPIGYWRYFYKNGYIESEGSYENGVYNGKWIRYFDPEGIVTRLRYDKKIPEDSIPDLKQFQYKVWGIQNFKNGVGEGEFVNYAYHSVDKPVRITNYKNGKLDGKSIAYYDNGIIYYEQNYKDGKLDGYERFYHLNGQLRQEGKFVQNKATGAFKLYNETGELIKTTIDKRPD